VPFLDIYLPAKVPGTPCVSAPRTKTTIAVNAGGRERRNQEWEHPLHRFVLPEATARGWEVVQDLAKMWRITSGPYRSFAWRDPLDFASCDLVKPNQVPTVALNDQYIGTGDGFTDAFQLVKTYSYGGETYDRTIHLPVLATVIVAIDGVVVDEADYTVSRPGGMVTFAVPPPATAIITAGFLFDCEVRFESDDALEGILRAHHAAGFADLTLIEVRPC
jgi:uncharacterized protein (TIGR02217 family)